MKSVKREKKVISYWIADFELFVEAILSKITQKKGKGSGEKEEIIVCRNKQKKRR